MVIDAQQKKAAVLEELDRAKERLDQKIEELRNFEQGYRASLRSYIQGQLSELDASGGEPEPAGAGQQA